MKFYGTGVLRYPGTSRTVWDFEDGPFDTVNPEIIKHAKNMGFSTSPPVEVKPVEVEALKVEEAQAPKPRRGRSTK